MLVIINTNDLVSPEVLCSSSSGKKKATSTGGYKRQAHTTWGCKQQATSAEVLKRQAPSEERYKPQASSDKQIESLFLNPSFSSAKILVPENNLQEPWLGFLASINVFCGCFTWNAIWCGENLILLPDVTFNSTVKKCPKALYPNRSGVPNKLLFSILVHDILGVILLSSCHNFVSGFIKIMTVTDVYKSLIGEPIFATSSWVVITILCVSLAPKILFSTKLIPVSYTHLRAHET